MFVYDIQMKYETTLKVRSQEKFISLRQLLEALFYRNTTLAKKAEDFLELIKGEELRDSAWQKVQERLEMGHVPFYTMRNKLRDAGMIYKKDGMYFVSRQFALRAGEMADIWDAFVKQ